MYNNNIKFNNLFQMWNQPAQNMVTTMWGVTIFQKSLPHHGRSAVRHHFYLEPKLFSADDFYFLTGRNCFESYMLPAKCEYWTYSVLSQKCYLKGSDQKSIPAEVDLISGAKDCNSDAGTNRNKHHISNGLKIGRVKWNRSRTEWVWR